MKEATLAQGNQVLNLILQKRVSCERLQAIIRSGLLSDLFESDFVDIAATRRKDFCTLINVRPYILKEVDCSDVVVSYSARLPFSRGASDYEWPADIKGFSISDGNCYDAEFRKRVQDFDELLSVKGKKVICFALLKCKPGVSLTLAEDIRTVSAEFEDRFKPASLREAFYFKRKFPISDDMNIIGPSEYGKNLFLVTPRNTIHRSGGRVDSQVLFFAEREV